MRNLGLSALILGVAGLALWPALPPRPLLAGAAVLGIGLTALGNRWRPFGLFLLGSALAGASATRVIEARSALPPRSVEPLVVVEIADLPRPGPPALRFEARVRVGEGLPPGARLRLAWYGAPAKQPAAGELWRLRVRLRPPRAPVNPGVFDGERHALERRLLAVGTVREGERLAAAPRWALARHRERLAAAIRALGDGDGPRLLAALAVGDRRGLDDRLWSVLQATGTGHLMAISGLHIGLAAGLGAALAALALRLAPRLALWLPRRHWALLLGLPWAVFYAALAGFAVPTRRALLMLLVAGVALLLRRALDPWQLLLLAATGVLLADPLAALGASFWLSVAGVAILILWVPSAGGAARRLAHAQAALSLAMLPLAALWFGSVPLVGFLANLIAVPLVGLVVVPAALIAALGESAIPGGGHWLFALAAGLLEGLVGALGWLAERPFASLGVGRPSAMALVLAAAGVTLLLAPRGLPGRLLGAPLLLPLLLPGPARLAPGELRLNLLDVGQGTALLLRTPEFTLLYDAGPAYPGGWDAGEQVVVPALRALGVRHLDLIVISHADADHAGGLAAVRRAFPEARLIASGVPGSEPCRAGERMAIGETRLDWLHPPEHMPDLRNESSCVLRLRHGGVAVLLPGDIGRLIEGRLLRERREELRAEAVLVPHHGSRHSSSPGFVAATGARFALVSAGTDNPFGHPAPEVVARWRAAGARILATGCGMIELRHDPARGWRIRAERVAAPRAWRARCDPALAGG